MNDFKDEVSSFFKELQDNICSALENADGKAKFHQDQWSREGGGGGRTRIIQDGSVIEKGGVNFSAVEGNLPENIAKALQLNSSYFFATGVSIVIHPNSPLVPIIHMNVRYFETKASADAKEIDDSWFGGGIDLTPHYINKSDAAYFHNELKEVCDRFDASYYNKFKKWADDYFYIKHREETRGVGGIFFDRLRAKDGEEMKDLLEFVKGVGNTFAPVYTKFMEKNKDLAYGEKQELWQHLRRGRYVEFNLVLDKGTKFGLDTNGRIESILMSLPKKAGWEYDFQVEPGSEEEATLQLLKKEVDWLSFLD